MSIIFDHPAFLTISLTAGYLYSAKLYGKKAALPNLLIFPFIALFAGFYSYFNHFGVTIIAQNFTENHITLESVVYGAVSAVRICSVAMWMECVFMILSTDKVIYLFGKISPKLSLFISITLRMVPGITARMKKINTAMCGTGRGISQGNIPQRIINTVKIAGMTVTWTLENLVESSLSMKNRGYSLKGRTAFSIYRFDNRDRVFVTVLLWLFSVVLMGHFLDQTCIAYNPQIIMNTVTPVSILFYLAYFLLATLPLILQTAGEIRFRHLQKKT